MIKIPMFRKLGHSLIDMSTLASEYANSNCDVDYQGDVWDDRGHYWSEATKADFLDWLDRNYPGMEAI